MLIVLCAIGRWSLEQIVDSYDIPEISASAASRNSTNIASTGTCNLSIGAQYRVNLGGQRFA
jgi:hypothetical protein